MHCGHLAGGVLFSQGAPTPCLCCEDFIAFPLHPTELLFGFSLWALFSTILLDLFLTLDVFDLVLAPGAGPGSCGMIKPSTWLLPTVLLTPL